MNYTEIVLAIDMGGTNTELALINRDGKILSRDRVPTRGHEDFSAYTLAVKEKVDSMLPSVPGCKLQAVGAGVPCANPTTGCIEAATELPWPSPIPVAGLFANAFGVPAFITNDANAAAAGEMLYGSMKGVKNFVVITLGTGVGAGVVCDGHVLGGSRGFAGELGHVVVNPAAKRICGCGRPGCLQIYCSASGIVGIAKDMLSFGERPSTLRDIPEDQLTSAVIYNEAMAGDSLAKDVFDYAGTVLGSACANFAAFSDPDAFVFFGGVAKAGELLLRPARAAFKNAALHLYRDRVAFTLSSLPDADAALLGAGALAWSSIS